MDHVASQTTSGKWHLRVTSLRSRHAAEQLGCSKPSALPAPGCKCGRTVLLKLFSQGLRRTAGGAACTAASTAALVLASEAWTC